MQVNEHYLFHGTKSDFVDAIINDGLDCRIASDNAMLGRGIYASESATKADQYTGRSIFKIEMKSKSLSFRHILILLIPSKFYNYE